MKLKELKPIVFSVTGHIQTCIVYDRSNNVDIEYGCSVEYAYEHYGEREVHRVFAAYENGTEYIVFSII